MNSVVLRSILDEGRLYFDSSAGTNYSVMSPYDESVSWRFVHKLRKEKEGEGRISK